MGGNQGKPAGNVVSLDAVRQRRAFIALAHADWDWCQVRASFALSGIERKRSTLPPIRLS